VRHRRADRTATMDRSNDGGANGDGGANSDGGAVGGDGARRGRCGADGDPGDAARTAVAGSCLSQCAWKRLFGFFSEEAVIILSAQILHHWGDLDRSITVCVWLRFAGSDSLSFFI
jgi:hypothetical protein